MVCCKAVVLAAIICASTGAAVRIKAGSKRTIEEQPPIDQLSISASSASLSHYDELNLDELLALDDLGMEMSAAARPSVPVAPLYMSTLPHARSKQKARRKAAEWTAIKKRRPRAPDQRRRERPSVQGAALQKARLPCTPSNNSKCPEAPSHPIGGVLQGEVGQNTSTTVAEQERLPGNSPAHDLIPDLEEVKNRGTEGGLDVNELLDEMVDALKDESDGEEMVDPPVSSAAEARTWALIEDLLDQPGVDFEDAMQQYDAMKCPTIKQLYVMPLKECCKVARIWSNCEHGARFLRGSLRRFNRLRMRFPSVPRHLLAKAASLDDLGLLPDASPGKGKGSALSKWLGGNWPQQILANPPGFLSRLSKAELQKCCADNGLNSKGTRPVLAARLKASGHDSRSCSAQRKGQFRRPGRRQRTAED